MSMNKSASAALPLGVSKSGKGTNAFLDDLRKRSAGGATASLTPLGVVPDQQGQSQPLNSKSLSSLGSAKKVSLSGYDGKGNVI